MCPVGWPDASQTIMTILARIPITYVTQDGTVVHSPMIHGRIGGIETRFVLDTGSEVHLLTRELADRVGISGTPGEEGTDHAGATLASWDLGRVDLRVDAASDDAPGGSDPVSLPLNDVVAIPAPPPFPGWGVGGILSPQQLHPTATIVIDMRADEVILIDATDRPVERYLADRSPDLTTLELERDRSFPSVVVRAAIDPYDEIAVMLNTGGKSTEFLTDVVPGVTHGPAIRTGGGVSGADVRGADGGQQSLRVAGQLIPVARLQVRDAMIEPYGLVGMDVLRGTLIAVAADTTRPIVWQVTTVTRRPPGATRS
jgi:Aspartyl protease